MWIKICGNTNLEDATLAAELGADALGFIFAESKRQVTSAQVSEISRQLPESVERIGVFDSQDSDAIVRAVASSGLHAAQLHGGYNEALLVELAARGICTIPVLHWSTENADASRASAEQIENQLQRVASLGVADRVLIDSKIGGSPSGGTGIPFNWTAAAELFASAPRPIRVIAAGGLRPENVAEAIQQLSPFGVDVSSGVEASAGRKDRDRLTSFIARAREASRPR